MSGDYTMSEPHDELTIPLLSVAKASKRLGVCPRTLYSITKSGGLRCVRIGRRVLYDPRDLQTWIEAQKGGQV